jgi:two-component system, LytTR family, sensor histidine kinase AlgZ
MYNQLTMMDSFLYNDFIFAKRYRGWRHVIYWLLQVFIWSTFWMIMGSNLSFARLLFNTTLWIPVFILFSYPLAYVAIPRLLLKGKVIQFFTIILVWGATGLFITAGFQTYIYVPVQEAMGFADIPNKGLHSASYLCMTTSAVPPMIVKFFKLWITRQRSWLQAQQEKITAELQLLKSQVHPHFLFNTLNNIYAFSIEGSPKTPGLILKLSSLLSYILYDCKAEKVRLEKEIEILKNYIDLEKERYGTRIDISWSVRGEVNDKMISPLLMLPFLENAFKHGASEQLGKAWLSVEISVQSDVLRCKIVNSKNDFLQIGGEKKGIGISNVKKRLEFIYPNSYGLEMNDEGLSFVVLLIIMLKGYTPISVSQLSHKTQSVTV